MKVTILPEDMERANAEYKENDASSFICPLAQALNRVTGETGWKVVSDVVSPHGSHYALSRAAIRFIDQWDGAEVDDVWEQGVTFVLRPITQEAPHGQVSG